MVDLPAGFRIVQQPQQAQQPAQAPALPEGFRVVTPQAAPSQEPTFTEKLAQTWPAQIARSIYGAVTLPGDVMAGRVNPTSDEAIERSFDLAGVASPLSAGARPAPMVAPRPPRPGQQVAEAAGRLGVALPRAVTSDRTSVQQMGRIAANVPIGGTPLRKASEQAIQGIDDAARRVQQGYGAGDVAGAGAGARMGIRQYATGTLEDLMEQRYNAVDSLVNPEITAPLNSTAQMVRKLESERSQAALGPSPATGIVQEALQRGGMNYPGIKRLRTDVGEMLKAPQMAPAGTSQSELRALYKSLSEDLRNAAKVSGGDDALRAFEDANSFAARSIDEQKALDKVLGTQSDEGIFSRITAMAGSTARADQARLAQVRAAVSDDTWNEIASAVLNTMGRDPQGNFSPDRFLTAYGKLSKNGKNFLFNSTGKAGLAQSLDDIATVSARFKQLNQFANPSGTAQNVLGPAAAFGIISAPLETITSIAGARVASNILARPASAKTMARWAKAYEQAVTKPSVAAQQALTQRSKALSLVIANDLGAPQAASQITNALSGGAIKLAADEEGQRPPEGQGVPNQGVATQPRRLMANEL